MRVTIAVTLTRQRSIVTAKFRVVVRTTGKVDIVYGTAAIVVPSWDPNHTFYLKREEVPEAVWRKLAEGRQSTLHVSLTLGVGKPEDMEIDHTTWELE